MCRNITELRGLEPPATRDEMEAAARQYIRKVTGIAKPNVKIAGALDELALVPDRRQPPPTLPPLRRPEVRKRLGLAPFPS